MVLCVRRSACCLGEDGVTLRASVTIAGCCVGVGGPSGTATGCTTQPAAATVAFQGLDVDAMDLPLLPTLLAGIRLNADMPRVNGGAMGLGLDSCGLMALLLCVWEAVAVCGEITAGAPDVAVEGGWWYDPPARGDAAVVPTAALLPAVDDDEESGRPESADARVGFNGMDLRWGDIGGGGEASRTATAAATAAVWKGPWWTEISEDQDVRPAEPQTAGPGVPVST
ncbi:hypothetical protein Vafri_20913 [Volvox africanus]|uniref:Uncharacterized protein n=1 Tax=Volvox africanus TaxID=51714 RepID=A0A8J4BT66_9CHLO|nr:hypothetical protein Vafri_20913 [Volvox africanus]